MNTFPGDVERLLPDNQDGNDGQNVGDSGGDSGGNSTGDSGECSAGSSLGFWAVIFLTVNATLGAGMLNIPYAFHASGGIVGSSILHSIHLLLVISSLVFLSHLCHKSSQPSFQSLTRHYCGALLANFTSLCILLYSFGSSVTYLLIIRDQLDKVFSTFYPASYDQSWYFNGNLILFYIAFITILPLCCSKDISFLKYASFFGFLCTLYLTFLVFIEYLKLRPQLPVQNLGTLTKLPVQNAGFLSADSTRKWTEIFNVLPVLTFSYQCQLSWIPTYVQAKNPTGKGFIFGSIFVSMIICFASYTWTAIFGLLTFGPDGLAKDIMQNYDPKDLFVSTAMILLILKTVVLFPVIMYVGRVVIEDLIFTSTSGSPSGPPSRTVEPYNESLIRWTVSTLWVLSAAMLAIYVPNISVAINYLGSLANLFVFILPGLILFRAVLFGFLDQENPKWESRVDGRYLAAAVVFVGYGTFVMVISVAQTIRPEVVEGLSLHSLMFSRG